MQQVIDTYNQINHILMEIIIQIYEKMDKKWHKKWKKKEMKKQKIHYNQHHRLGQDADIASRKVCNGFVIQQSCVTMLYIIIV